MWMLILEGLAIGGLLGLTGAGGGILAGHRVLLRCPWRFRAGRPDPQRCRADDGGGLQRR